MRISDVNVGEINAPNLFYFLYKQSPELDHDTKAVKALLREARDRWKDLQFDETPDVGQIICVRESEVDKNKWYRARVLQNNVDGYLGPDLVCFLIDEGRDIIVYDAYNDAINLPNNSCEGNIGFAAKIQLFGLVPAQIWFNPVKKAYEVVEARQWGQYALNVTRKLLQEAIRRDVIPDKVKSGEITILGDVEMTFSQKFVDEFRCKKDLKLTPDRAVSLSKLLVDQEWAIYAGERAHESKKFHIGLTDYVAKSTPDRSFVNGKHVIQIEDDDDQIRLPKATLEYAKQREEHRKLDRKIEVNRLLNSSSSGEEDEIEKNYQLDKSNSLFFPGRRPSTNGLRGRGSHLSRRSYQESFESSKTEYKSIGRGRGISQNTGREVPNARMLPSKKRWVQKWLTSQCSEHQEELVEADDSKDLEDILEGEEEAGVKPKSRVFQLLKTAKAIRRRQKVKANATLTSTTVDSESLLGIAQVKARQDLSDQESLVIVHADLNARKLKNFNRLSDFNDFHSGLFEKLTKLDIETTCDPMQKGIKSCFFRDFLY